MERREAEKIANEKFGIKLTKTKVELKQRAEVEYKFREAIADIIDYKKLASTFLHIQPLHFDKSKLWWAWNFKTSAWEIIDEIDLMNMFDAVSNWSGTINTKVKIQLIEALKRAARLKKPIKVAPTWIQFKNKIVDFMNDKEESAGPDES